MRFHNDCISEDLSDFISSCLKTDPKERPPANELLNHRFIQKYVPEDEHRRLKPSTSDTIKKYVSKEQRDAEVEYVIDKVIEWYIWTTSL